MKVSIIVPVYNVEEFVEGCLESINAQTYQDYEVIVVEDCSTDNSKCLVEEYVKTHEKFRLLPLEKNGGPMHAWMEGVKVSKGDYFFFVDSDDTITPDAVETLVNIVDKYGVDIACGNTSYDTRRYGGGLAYHNNYLNPGLYTGEKLIEFQKAIFPTTKHHYFSPGRVAKLFERNLFLSNLKYCDTSISSGEDVNIVVPCVLSARSIYFEDKPIYYYLYNMSSISHRFNPNILNTYNKLIDKLSQAASMYNGIFTEEIKELYVVYGYGWCTYVKNSGLSTKEKCAKISMLFDTQYAWQVSIINRQYEIRLMIYKYAIAMKSPLLFLRLSAIVDKLGKIIRRYGR